MFYTNSNSSKKDITSLINFDENKIKVIYLAAGSEFRVLKSKEKAENVRKKYNLPQKFVLYVGDVTWNKNLPRLIDAIKTTNIPLVMVGKNLAKQDYDRQNPWNHDLNRVNDLVKDDSRIIRLGFVESNDLIAIYNAATVFIMPSLYEGFGLPILEAQACGCPVITTREGSLKEVASSSAYFVDGYDYESIAEGIKNVFNNNDLQEQLRQKGFENIKKFSWEKTAKMTIESYKKILG